MAMFPPGLPRDFIQRYSSKGEIVFDPFSGRGTTILESCLMGRIGIGNDKNPLAYLLTKTKSNLPSKKRVISRLNNLEKDYEFENIKINSEDEDIKMLFHPDTLKQLIFLKKELYGIKEMLIH